MAGQMGTVRNTTQNIEVVSVDDDDGIILLRGAVPGPKNGWVLISDAIKTKLPDAAPFPAGLARAVSANSVEQAPVEEVAENAALIVDAPEENSAVEEQTLNAESEDTAAESKKE